MKESYAKVKARVLIAVYAKKAKEVETMKDLATEYCDTIIADIEMLEDPRGECIIAFYLLVKHEISKIDTPF